MHLPGFGEGRSWGNLLVVGEVTSATYAELLHPTAPAPPVLPPEMGGRAVAAGVFVTPSVGVMVTVSVGEGVSVGLGWAAAVPVSWASTVWAAEV